MKKAFQILVIAAVLALSVISLSAQTGQPQDTLHLWGDPLALPLYSDSLVKIGPRNLVLYEGIANQWYKIKKVSPDTTWLAQEIEINAPTTSAYKLTWSADMVYGSGLTKFFNSNFQYVATASVNATSEKTGTLEFTCLEPCRVAVWTERFNNHGGFNVLLDNKAPVWVNTKSGAGVPENTDKDRNLSSYTSPTLKKGAHVLKLKITTQSAIDRFTLLKPTVVFK